MTTTKPRAHLLTTPLLTTAAAALALTACTNTTTAPTPTHTTATEAAAIANQLLADHGPGKPPITLPNGTHATITTTETQNPTTITITYTGTDHTVENTSDLTTILTTTYHFTINAN